MSEPTYRRFAVAVAGGELAVGSWGPEDASVVVAVHGITSNHLAFAELAAAAPIAP